MDTLEQAKEKLINQTGMKPENVDLLISEIEKLEASKGADIRNRAMQTVTQAIRGWKVHPLLGGSEGVNEAKDQSFINTYSKAYKHVILYFPELEHVAELEKIKTHAENDFAQHVRHLRESGEWVAEDYELVNGE